MIFSYILSVLRIKRDQQEFNTISYLAYLQLHFRSSSWDKQIGHQRVGGGRE